MESPPLNGMPYKSTLELYSEIILPKLQGGPMTCEEMDVPRYAAQHVKAHKLIVCRMRTPNGANGRRLSAVEVYMLPEHVLPKLMDRATMGIAARWESRETQCVTAGAGALRAAACNGSENELFMEGVFQFRSYAG
jgi:hypothetical protein